MVDGTYRYAETATRRDKTEWAAAGAVGALVAASLAAAWFFSSFCT